MSDKTGGSAFPTPETEKLHPQFGMSLRDYFAAQAMAAAIHVCLPQECHGEETMEQMFARKAYQAADAMLAERAKAGA